MVTSDMRNGTAGDAMILDTRSITSRRDSVGIVNVTPAIARAWLERMRFPNQRPVREHHVRFLANEIAMGRFRLSTIDIRECDGCLYLVNGQHRLHAAIRANATVPMVVVQRRSSELEEVSRDYAAFDRGLVRSHADGLMGYGLTGETGLNSKQLKAMSGAAPVLLSGFQAGGIQGKSGVSTQERAVFVRAWSSFGLLACATIGEANVTRVRRLYNAAYFSVALVTFRYAPDRAEAFWGRLAENDGLRKGDPEQGLIDFVVDRAAMTGRQAYASRAAAACWNAAHQGRMLRQVKVMDPTAPIRILGTPFDGTAHLAYADLP